ncbi:MAG: hypothetical protein WCC11_07355 [Gammaproteobacteria bacterium]
MNHSKYNPKYDPKHSSYQPQATAPVVQAPTVKLAMNTQPAQATTAPQIATKSHAQVITDPNRQDSKSDSQNAPVAVKADAAISDKDMDTSISDSRQPVTAKSVHAVREPSAMTGGLPELPAAKMNRETGENTPGLSAKTIS